MSALGHKQTYALQKAMSALPPIATAKAYSRKGSCLLYPPKADMCAATSDVRYGPKADILVSFDHFVGNLLKLPRNLKAERLRGLEIDC